MTDLLDPKRPFGARPPGPWARWTPVALAALLLHPLSAAGLAWPDLDFTLRSVLGHRSALTHSVLLPLLVLALAPLLRRLRRPSRAVARRSLAWAMGWFLLGLGIHLLADSFPRGCTGGALAHLPRWPPGSGSVALPCGVSLAWLAGNAVAAVVLAEWLMRREGTPLTLARYVASAAVLAVYMVAHEGKPLLLPLAALAWFATAWAARTVAIRLA
jgi:hypothetical protein